MEDQLEIKDSAIGIAISGSFQLLSLERLAKDYGRFSINRQGLFHYTLAVGKNEVGGGYDHGVSRKPKMDNEGNNVCRCSDTVSGLSIFRSDFFEQVFDGGGILFMHELGHNFGLCHRPEDPGHRVVSATPCCISNDATDEEIRHADCDFDVSEYELSMVSVNTIGDLESDGESVIIVALVGTDPEPVNKDLHIRIFNASGEMIVDKGEGDLISGLNALKQRLVSSLPGMSIPQEDIPQIIEDAASIAGYFDEIRSQRDCDACSDCSHYWVSANSDTAMGSGFQMNGLGAGIGGILGLIIGGGLGFRVGGPIGGIVGALVGAVAGVFIGGYGPDAIDALDRDVMYEIAEWEALNLRAIRCW